MSVHFQDNVDFMNTNVFGPYVANLYEISFITVYIVNGYRHLKKGDCVDNFDDFISISLPPLAEVITVILVEQCILFG